MPVLQSTRFDELKATGQLPSPTGVALEILRLSESERTTANDIARILQADPALAGRILKLANGSNTGRSRPVTSVRDAITHLGTRLVRNLALGFSLLSQHTRGACPTFPYQDYWSRSLAAGVAAQAGASFLGKIAPSEAFTCGLLSQIGRLALATVYPEAYGTLLTQVDPEIPGHLCQLEQEQFATDHNELSAALIRDWGLPDPCAIAIQHHENPEQSGLTNADRTQGLVRLLHLAMRVASVCVAPDETRTDKVLELFSCSDQLEIPGRELIDIADRVVSDWQDWGRVLQVPTQAVPPLAELVQRAQTARAQAPPYTVEAVVSDMAAPQAGCLRIVIVDDDPVELRLLSAQLRTVGHQVTEATDGVEGLRTVLDVNPQLLITDRNMPGMDGVALCKALRETKLGRHIYVIMLTGAEEEVSQVEAFEAGADDYITKPFRPKILAARLRACQRLLQLQEEVQREKEELQRVMTELGVANRKLQQAALTDALTGLYNRRYAMERLEQEWAEATRGGHSLSCMLIDIDHFKRVNDTYGHDVGDLVLQETGAVLCQSLRGSDVVCRLGGEEFLVIAPTMDLRTVEVCGDRLRRRVEEKVISTGRQTVRVTVSVGGATRVPRMASPMELLKAADLAVYAAKQSGRNRVCLALSPAESPI